MELRFPALFGVRLRLYPFWLLAYVLLALGIFTVGVPGTTGLSLLPELMLGLIAAALLVVSYALHEYSHGIVAHGLTMPVEEVGLFGLVDQRKPPVDPPSGRTETIVALAGLVVTLLLAAIFWFAWASVGIAQDEVSLLIIDTLWWVAAGNLALAIINAAPAYPYDGGRIIRGVLWSILGDKLRATRAASRIGRAFAVALMLGGGLWAFVSGDLINPLWLFIAGLFLLQSSRRQIRRYEIGHAVEGLTVSDVMNEKFDVVGPNLTIDTLHQQHERDDAVDTYPVTSDGVLIGSIDVGQIERIPRAQWARTRVTDVMTTLERLQTLTRPQSVMDALMSFERSTADAIPVVDESGGNRLVGLVTRATLIDRLRPRMRSVADRDRPAQSSS